MSVRRILSVSLTFLVLTALLPILPLPHVNAATAPSMGVAASFTILGGSTVTNTGNSIISGDLGLYPGTSVTGFPPGVVVPPGAIHAADALAGNAQIAVTTAYNALATQAADVTYGSGKDLGGLTLTAGVYHITGSAGLTGTLTLDGQSNPNAVFIFQIDSALTTASASVVDLINSASSCNVFFKVASSATLGTTTNFRGSIIALQSITLNNGASVSGRLFARSGAVTLINNNAAAPCIGSPPVGVGVNKIFTPSVISMGGVSTLNITFTNTNFAVATLQSPFIDNLPNGVVIAGTPNVVFIGGVGVPTATPGGSTVTLPAGSTIPGGTITNPGLAILRVDVTSQRSGSLLNTLGVGALHTDLGDSASATGVTLVVSGEGAVGGVVMPTSKLEILAPFAALASLLAAVSTVVVVKKRKA